MAITIQQNYNGKFVTLNIGDNRWYFSGDKLLGVTLPEAGFTAIDPDVGDKVHQNSITESKIVVTSDVLWQLDKLLEKNLTGKLTKKQYLAETNKLIGVSS